MAIMGSKRGKTNAQNLSLRPSYYFFFRWRDSRWSSNTVLPAKYSDHQGKQIIIVFWIDDKSFLFWSSSFKGDFWHRKVEIIVNNRYSTNLQPSCSWFQNSVQWIQNWYWVSQKSLHTFLTCDFWHIIEA
mgnify:CR=1 FL=1